MLMMAAWHAVTAVPDTIAMGHEEGSPVSIFDIISLFICFVNFYISAGANLAPRFFLAWRVLSLFSKAADSRRAWGGRCTRWLRRYCLFMVLVMLAGARFYRQVCPFIRAHLPRVSESFGLSLRRAPA